MNKEKKEKKLLQRDKEALREHNVWGCLDSPEDNRDFRIDDVMRAAQPLPEYYVTEGKVPVLNQLATSMCVAHACATAIAYGEYKAGFKNHHDFSRAFIYGNRTATDYQGEGMIVREALKRLNHDGDCLHSDFDFLEDYPSIRQRFTKRETELREKAAPYPILNYFRCYTNDEVKRALINQGAVLVSINIYEGFGTYTKLPEPGAKSQGGHCMCCIGWDKDGWIIQNSWGSISHDKGKLHLPFEYPVKEWWGITVNKDVPEPKNRNIFVRFFSCVGSYIKHGWYWVKRFFINLFKKKDAE